MSDDPLDRALGIVPDCKSEIVQKLIYNAMDDSAKEDFTYARANVREVVENGAEAIVTLSNIAAQTQNPRAFEVLAKLMDTVVSANRELLDMQQKIRKIADANDHHNDGPKTINNTMFIGSTAELAKMIDDMDKNKTITQ